MWGWEPETRLIRDEHGYRLEREPEFSPQDVDLLVAFREIKAETTPNGFKWWEETSPLGDPENPDAQFYFEAKPPIYNHVVRERELAMKRLRAQAKTVDGGVDEEALAGIVIPIVKVSRS